MQFSWKKCILLVAMLLLLAPVLYAPPDNSNPANPTGTSTGTNTVGGIVYENATIVQLSKTKDTDGSYTLSVVVLAVDSKNILPYLQTKSAAESQLHTLSLDTTPIHDLTQQLFNQNFASDLRVLKTQVSIRKMDFTRGRYVDLDSAYGCKNIITDQNFNQAIYSPIDPTNPITATFGSCKIPYLAYKGTCIYVVAFHTPDQNSIYKYRKAPPSIPLEICDDTLSSTGVLRDNLKTAFTPPPVGSQDYFTWIAAFALIGLLIASMYFSGKNPLSLLDINTPKLPSPKGIAVGGQILGPFGYTEMKLWTNKATNATIKTINALMPAYLSMNQVRSKWGTIQRIADSEIPRSATIADKMILGPVENRSLGVSQSDIEKSKGFAKGIGVAGALAGYDILSSNFRSLLSTHLYQWKEPQHALFGELVSKLEKNGGNQKALSQLLVNYYMGMEQYKRLETLTGHPDIGKRSKWVQMVHTAVGATVGSGRFVHLTSFPHSAIDSMIRSGPVVARFGSALVGASLDLVSKGQFSKKVGAFADKAKNKDSLLVRTASAFAGASPDRVVLGYLYPINDKMKQQYALLRDAAYRDIMRYAISKTMKKNGIMFNLTAEEISEHGYKYGAKHLMERMGMTEESLRNIGAFEAQLHSILKDTTLTLHQKTEKILALAGRYGVSTHEARHEMDYLSHLDANKDVHEEVKLIDLYQHFQDYHAAIKEDRKNETDHFRYNIALDNLKAHEAWEAYNVQRMIWEIEKGYLKEGAGIREVVEQSWIDLLNRTSSLDPTNKSHGAGTNTNAAIDPKNIRNTSMPEFMARELVANYGNMQAELLGILGRHLTEEGRATFREMNGHVFDPNTVTMAEMSNLLHGYKKIARDENVAEVGEAGLPVSRKNKKQAMFYLEDDKEVPTREGWWKTDKQRLYVDGLNSREAFALGQYVQYRFTRANTPFHDAEIERQLARDHPDLNAMSPEARNNLLKKAYLEKLLMKDIHEFMNSTVGYGVYQGGQEQMRFMTKTSAAFLAHALKESEERPGQNQDTIRFLEHLDISNRDHLIQFKQLYADHKDKVDALLKKPLTYNDMAKSKSTWVQMYEGGFVPYLHGMPISAFDRTLGGYVAIENKAKNRWERVDLADIGDAQIRETFGQERSYQFNSLKGQTDKEALVTVLDRNERPILNPATGQPMQVSWRTFLEEINIHRDQNNFQQEKVFAALIKSYGDTTGDQHGFWDLSNMRIMPKRDVAPLAPQIWRFFGADPEIAKSRPVQRARDAMLGVGDWISRISFAAAGPVHEASWEITGFSEAYKQNLWHMAHAIHTKQFDELINSMDPIKQKKARSELTALGFAASGYRGVWLWTIDRNPWEMFKDYGYMQRLSSGFQYGPRKTYPVSFNLRPTMSTQEYMNFYLLGGFMMDDKKVPFTNGKLKIPGLRSMFDVYASMFRTAQEELQGSAARFDIQEHYTRPYVSTQPRLRNFVQALANPFASHAFQLPGLKQLQEKLDLGGVGMKRFGAGQEV